MTTQQETKIMNKELKILARRKRWIDALKSGKFKQAYFKLHTKVGNDNKYCCLGVALKVCNFKYNQDTPTTRCTTTLSFLNLKKLGLNIRDQSSLMGLNDYQRKSFPEIAAFIETLPVSY